MYFHSYSSTLNHIYYYILVGNILYKIYNHPNHTHLPQTIKNKGGWGWAKDRMRASSRAEGVDEYPANEA